MLLPLPYLAFDVHASWHLALAALLGVAMSLCVFALLRELGLSAVASIAAAALVLAFPWSDSLRLWATGGMNQVAACLYLIGATIALRGLAVAPAARRRNAYVSLALFAASLLTYPAAVLLVGASTLLYRLRVSWAEAWRRGRWDLALAAVIMIYVGLTTTKPRGSPGSDLSHATTVLDQWLTLVARSIEPFGSPPRGWVLLGLAAILLAAVAAARPRTRRADGESSAAIARWLKIAAAGAFASLLSYGIYAVGDPKYLPLASGLYNRVGMLAAPGLAVLVVALAGIFFELIRQAVGSPWRPAAGAVAGAIVCFALAGWVVRARDDAALWDDAATWSRRVLTTLDAVVPPAQRGRVVYATGFPRYVADGIPVFSSSFDLPSAVALEWDDAGARAYPLTGGLRCGRRAIAPRDPAVSKLERSRYGDAVLVNVRQQRATELRSPSRCRKP